MKKLTKSKRFGIALMTAFIIANTILIGTILDVMKKHSITASDQTIYVGSTKPINAIATADSLTYDSSDTTVVTVNSKGILTGRRAGTAEITITAKETPEYKAASKTITVTVIPKLRITPTPIVKE